MTEILESNTVRLSIAFIICIISFAVIWNIDQQHQIIYVPTESNHPLLEAGRIGNSTR